jgi:hypothetical protein
MKHKKIIMILSLLGVFVGLSFVVSFYALKPMPVFFYGLNDTEQEGFKKVILDFGKTNHHKFVFLNGPTAISKTNAFPQKTVAIFRTGAMANQQSESFTSVNPEILNRTATAVHRLVRREGASNEFWAIPLLINNLEFFRRDQAKSPGAAGVVSISQATALLTEHPGTTHALAMPAADDSLLLDVIGQLTVSSGGLDQYRSLCAQTLLGTPPSNLMGTIPAFNEAMSTLKLWKRTGTIHPNWIDMTTGDISRLLTRNSIDYVIQRLSDHRALSEEALTNSHSGRFLDIAPEDLRVSTIGTIALAVPKTGRWRNEAERLSAWLSGPEAQNALATQTGLAPTVLRAQAPDLQSRMARQFASEGAAISGWSQDGFTDDKQRSSFAAELRLIIAGQ